MTRVIEINDIDALEDHRLAWSSLLRQTRKRSFFQTLDWLQCYWRHYGSDQRLRVLLVTDGRKPLGIVPLTVLRERTGVGPMRVLTYPLHAWGWFYGPIGPHPAATLTAAMRHLASSRRDWDMIDLRWIDNDRLDHGRTQCAMETVGLACAKRVWETTAVVDTSCGWDQYFAGMTTKHRNNIRRYQKRTAALGEISFERYRPLGKCDNDDDPRWDLYEECLQVAASSWQAQATDGTTISHASIRPFLRDCFQAGVNSGMIDLCLLRLNQRPIAFSYNYFCDGYVTGIRFGFDAEFSKEGIGNVMYLRMLQDSFERGDRVVDLGVGSLRTKRLWQTGLVHSYRLTHYPLASPRSQILRLKHWWDRRSGAPVQLAS